MTKRVFVVLMMMVVVAVSVQAQGLPPRRTLGSRLARPSAITASNNSITNGNEKAQIEQRIKNGELPEPLIPIEEALALAEKGEGKGYYQLAVRYAKGDGVVEDDETAAKFLKKAYDARYPRAVFAVALGIENALHTYVDAEVCPSCHELLGATFRGQSLFKAFELKPVCPWSGISKGITNEVYVARVKNDYDMARKLGIVAAEKELARLERRVALARAQVQVDLEKENIQKKNDELARRLIDETAGKTRQFIPFPNSQKLPYPQALEGAEKSDPKSYYWLAYYFAKGEGVDWNGEAALKFLKKAVDANNPVACYTFGLLLEDEALQNEDGRSVGDQETGRGFEDMHFNLRPFGAAAWYTPVQRSGNKCLTNTVAVAHVESLYQKAIDGGFPYATNDIARLHRKIDDCKKRIVEKQMEKARREEAANKALSLLDDSAKMSEEDKAARDADAERELWQSWPDKLETELTAKIVAQAREKFKCAFYGKILDWDMTFTDNWKRGSGLALIVEVETTAGCALQKLDAEGRCVWFSNETTIDADELRWISEERRKALEAGQLKWAKEHGMTLDEAKAKYAKWKDEHPVWRRPLGGLRRPGMLGGGLSGGSLRARRLQRQQEAAAVAAKQREEQSAKEAERRAQAEQEKQQREQERAEQRQQLLAIQEELKRVRGVKAAAEKEAR